MRERWISAGRKRPEVDLLVDIGNSRVKWASWDGDRLGCAGALCHDADSVSGLAEIWEGLPRPAVVRLANVGGPGMLQAISRLATDLWGLVPEVVRPRSECLGLRIAYADPGRLGVDRWLAMLAAWERLQGPVLVVDCGSAVTLDAVDGAGAHLGGLILPGLRLSWGALFSGTGIPDLPFQLPGASFGTDTAACVGAGIIQAVVGAIELSRRRMQSAGFQPRVLLTGGDAPDIAAWVEGDREVVPGLVLEGLALLGD